MSLEKVLPSSIHHVIKSQTLLAADAGRYNLDVLPFNTRHLRVENGIFGRRNVQRGDLVFPYYGCIVYGNFSIANIPMDYGGAGTLVVWRKRFFDTVIYLRAVITLHCDDGFSGENISVHVKEVIDALHCSALRPPRQVLQLYQAPIAKGCRAKEAFDIP